MHYVKLLILLLIHLLVLYFTSVNCEICSRLVFIRTSKCIPKCSRGRNRVILSAVILIGALVLVPIKVECTLLQTFRDDGRW